MASSFCGTHLSESIVVVLPVQDDECNYHDPLLVRLRAIISNERKDVRVFSSVSTNHFSSIYK